MYSAHFDASGKADKNPSITVAGCLSNVDRWNKFNVAWNRILVDDGLPPGTIFHMTDFATCNRPFHIYKDNSAKKADLFSKLVECMTKHIERTFSVGVVIEDYNFYNSLFYLRENLGSPYAFAGNMAISLCQRWMGERKGKRKAALQVFFEKGDEEQDELDALARRLYGVKPVFIAKSDMVQFQPGDILGWKNRIAITNAILEGHKGDPEMLKSIQRSLAGLKKLSGFNGVYDTEALNRVCKGEGNPLYKGLPLR